MSCRRRFLGLRSKRLVGCPEMSGWIRNDIRRIHDQNSMLQKFTLYLKCTAQSSNALNDTLVLSLLFNLPFPGASILKIPRK